MACGAWKAAGMTRWEKFFGSLFFKKGTACFLAEAFGHTILRQQDSA
jgi:hypothetical protein